jgi:hypothetical protein
MTMLRLRHISLVLAAALVCALAIATSASARPSLSIHDCKRALTGFQNDDDLAPRHGFRFRSFTGDDAVVSKTQVLVGVEYEFLTSFAGGPGQPVVEVWRAVAGRASCDRPASTGGNPHRAINDSL